MKDASKTVLWVSALALTLHFLVDRHIRNGPGAEVYSLERPMIGNTALHDEKCDPPFMHTTLMTHKLP